MLTKRKFAKKTIARWSMNVLFVMLVFCLGLVGPPVAMADLEVTSTGDVGIGTSTPAASLEVRRSDGTAAIKVDENSGFVTKRQMFVLENNGALSFRFIDRNTNNTWQFDTTDNPPVGNFAINHVGQSGRELLLTKFGDMELKGNLTAAGVFYPSDRNMKDNVEPLDGGEVLRKVMELPISSYSYKSDSKKLRHIGPIAQDFQKIFGVGPDDRHISVADSSGIALAAIQQIVREKDAQLAKRDNQIAELEKRLLAMEIRLENLTQNIVQNDLLSSVSLNNIYR